MGALHMLLETTKGPGRALLQVWLTASRSAGAEEAVQSSPDWASAVLLVPAATLAFSIDPVKTCGRRVCKLGTPTALECSAWSNTFCCGLCCRASLALLCWRGLVALLFI